MYDGKSISTDNPMEHVAKDIDFRDVHFFLERCDDIAAIKGHQLVRETLFTLS